MTLIPAQQFQALVQSLDTIVPGRLFVLISCDPSEPTDYQAATNYVDKELTEKLVGSFLDDMQAGNEGVRYLI